MKTKKRFILFLAIFSGLLLAISTPTFGLPIILFIAFVPLIWIEDHITNNANNFSKYAVFKFSFFAIFIWNILTTYWICYATAFGLFAPFWNAVLGGLVFHLYHFTKTKLFEGKKGFIILPLFWISMEYATYWGDLTWPWLSIGNAFATMPILIQWYEYTGVFGGTLWVFIANYFAYKIIKSLSLSSNIKSIKIINNKIFLSSLSAFVISLFIPILLSLILWNTYKDESNKSVDVVVLQPNLEPYDETLQLQSYEVIDLLINLSKTKTDNNTSFILAPEGSLEERIWEDQMDYNIGLQRLSEFLGNYNQAQLITGSFTRKLQSKEEKDSYSREISDAPKPYYSIYNSAVHIRKDNKFEVYHKTKLVPGVERVPFKKYIGGIIDLAVKLGNLPVGSLGIDNQQKIFVSDKTGVKITTPICYESIYGNFVAQKVRDGAELVFIITNDSWWKNTQGYKQHASYASLRAIETRRYIARSANTGISCFINARGQVMEKTKFWTKDIIKASLIPQKRITFYVKYGDYIAKMSLFASFIILVTTLVTILLHRKK